MQNTIHVIGAGVSGLAAAVKLTNAGRHVHLHEATPQAGGRCRSFYDAATDLTIDYGRMRYRNCRDRLSSLSEGAGHNNAIGGLGWRRKRAAQD